MNIVKFENWLHSLNYIMFTFTIWQRSKPNISAELIKYFKKSKNVRLEYFSPNTVFRYLTTNPDLYLIKPTR